MDIHNRAFKRATIRGYKEDEVDEFLDRIVADYEKLFRDNEKLKEQLSLNEKEIAQFRKLEKNLQDTLMVAQSTAEEVISSAKKNAEETRNNARLECQNMREQAQIDARRQIEEATSKLNAITAEYDRLIRDKNAFLLKIRTALESELAVTNQLLSSIPRPDESKVQVSTTKIKSTQENVSNVVSVSESSTETKTETSSVPAQVDQSTIVVKKSLNL